MRGGDDWSRETPSLTDCAAGRGGDTTAPSEREDRIDLGYGSPPMRRTKRVVCGCGTLEIAADWPTGLWVSEFWRCRKCDRPFLDVEDQP